MSSENTYKVIFLRHSQSIYNRKGLFTGWIDCGLSRMGRKQAKKAGKSLKKSGFVFDIAFCSELKRAKQTLDIILKQMGLQDVVIKYSQALNERHYGALQGVNKKQAVKKYGLEKVFEWRRSFKTAPPKDESGFSESLEDTQNRVLPFWQNEIASAIKQGKKVFVCSHGSTMRALIKFFDNVSEKDVEELNVPLGLPLVYEFDEAAKPVKNYYLASKRKLRQAILKTQREIYGRQRARKQRRSTRKKKRR